MTRIVYLATADARGHLMRAQLLARALHAAGASVQLITTSDEGVRFLDDFDTKAILLSRHYAVQFDAAQNMLRRETDRNVAHYVFHPRRMLRDILVLRVHLRDADLLVNDSFHPALLFMGAMPFWRHKVVHIYGTSLRHSLETNFQGRLPGLAARLFGRIVAWQISRSRARIAHDFAYGEPEHDEQGGYRLATPVAVAETSVKDVADEFMPPIAAVYFNPHFSLPSLAEGIEQGLDEAGVVSRLVCEGYAGRPRWRARDERWIEFAARSSLIVSAPGMAALSIAAVYRKPILLLLTDQPEQAINAKRAAQLGLLHRVVRLRGESSQTARDVAQAAKTLMEASASAAPDDAGRERAIARLRPWVDLLLRLARD